MKNQKTIFILILSTAIVLRLAFLSKHAFWFDEAISYFIAKAPFFSLLNATAHDTHPPLYFLLLKLFSFISYNIYSLRFMSILLNIGSLILVYKIFQKLTDKKTTLIALSLLALSPLQIYFSTEMRMYALVLLETLALLWLYFQYTQSAKLKFLILYIIVATLILYTHYYSGLILLTLVFLSFIYKNKKINYRAWIISQGIILMLFAPWIWYALPHLRQGCWCFSSIIGVPLLIASYAFNSIGLVNIRQIIQHSSPFMLIIFSILALLLFLLFIYGNLQALKNKKGRITLLLFFVPLIILSLITLFKPFFSPRSLFFISPYFYLLVSMGITGINKQITRRITFLIILLLISSTLYVQFTNKLFYGPPIEQAAQYLSSSPKDTAMLHPDIATYYSFQVLHNFMYKEFLITPSAMPEITKKEVGGVATDLKDILPYYDKIWFVSPNGWLNNQKAIKNKINADFYLDKQIKYNNIFEDIDLYHFTRKSGKT